MAGYGLLRSAVAFFLLKMMAALYFPNKLLPFMDLDKFCIYKKRINQEAGVAEGCPAPRL